ncbi:hypothetical protein CGLO_14251 [Colletotrichum gloeosporioides Cg-14]|uniref:Uncharacterized protein n=1 Tax=Colletotrichum gloeosporioides (strain Cg-14) TaxID=1237896 RepID=T0K1T2_COLGC|nr:hypothetical protein CGLO_14251 [Colletotrichum gloeosporioides Cg-14]
MEEIAVMMLP